MKARWLVLLCLLVPTWALASGDAVEASMVVTGTIEVNLDGSVRDYSLDHQDKLPPGVIEVVTATVPRWKFKPVMRDAKPVLAKTQMSLRIVAHPTDSRHATLRVTGAAFGRDTEEGRQSAECVPGACLTYVERKPPHYPIDAVRNGVSGTVYVVLEVNRAGRVAQAAVSQVNLCTSSSSPRARRLLSDAVMGVVQDWKFHAPTTGDEAPKDHWIVIVPVNFFLSNRSQQYGQWDAYITGPVQEIPWRNDEATRSASNGGDDAIPDGAIYHADPRFVLLTPIGNVAPKSQAGIDAGQS